MRCAPVGTAVVMPRRMCFSPSGATSIDLYAHEIARTSRHAGSMTVFAERTEDPFDDVRTRFWEPGASKAARAKLIASSRPGIVVVHQHLPTAVDLARRLKGMPVALVRHNFVKPPGGAIARWRRRNQFGQLAGLGFVSLCCRDAFRSDWPDVALSLFVTPNGIDTAAWRPAAKKRRRIVFTGRLTPEKGVLETVRALRTVLARHAEWDAVLTLATAPRTDGYDEDVRAAIAAMGGRVTVLENLPHAEVRPIVAEASIAIAPTQTAEPFGRVAIEALASGTVLIATRRGGFVEVVHDAGILIEPPSAEAIADALEGLIADPARRARLAELGRARIAGQYDLASAAAAFDSMIDELSRPRLGGSPAAHWSGSDPLLAGGTSASLRARLSKAFGAWRAASRSRVDEPKPGKADDATAAGLTGDCPFPHKSAGDDPARHPSGQAPAVGGRKH